jgi:hypothetical protein
MRPVERRQRAIACRGQGIAAVARSCVTKTASYVDGVRLPSAAAARATSRAVTSAPIKLRMRLGATPSTSRFRHTGARCAKRSSTRPRIVDETAATPVT